MKDVLFLLADLWMIVVGYFYGWAFIRRYGNYLLGLEWMVVATSGTNFLFWSLLSGSEQSPFYDVAYFLDAFSRSFGITLILVMGLMKVTHRYRPSLLVDVGVFGLAIVAGLFLRHFHGVDLHADRTAFAVATFYVVVNLLTAVFLAYFVRRLWQAGAKGGGPLDRAGHRRRHHHRAHLRLLPVRLRRRLAHDLLHRGARDLGEPRASSTSGRTGRSTITTGTPERSGPRRGSDIMTITFDAAVFRTPNAPLTIERVALPETPPPGDVLVRMKASGLCHSDLHVLVGEWEVPTPMILGHEGAGIVERVGEGVTTLAEGDHVVLSWTRPAVGAATA